MGTDDQDLRFGSNLSIQLAEMFTILICLNGMTDTMGQLALSFNVSCKIALV